MDRDTLLAHRASWGREARPHTGPCGRLTGAEWAVFDDLVHNRLGAQVRLEQERIAGGAISRALATPT